MELNELIESFHIRNAETGTHVKFKTGFTKWHNNYLSEINDFKIHVDIKGRQVGLSKFYDLLAMEKFLDDKPFKCLIVYPSLNMVNNNDLFLNIHNLSPVFELNSHKKHYVSRQNGNYIQLTSAKKHFLYNNKPDYIFLDEFFHYDEPQMVLEEVINYITNSNYESLVKSGSSTSRSFNLGIS